MRTDRADLPQIAAVALRSRQLDRSFHTNFGVRSAGHACVVRPAGIG